MSKKKRQTAEEPVHVVRDAALQFALRTYKAAAGGSAATTVQAHTDTVVCSLRDLQRNDE